MMSKKLHVSPAELEEKKAIIARILSAPVDETDRVYFTIIVTPDELMAWKIEFASSHNKPVSWVETMWKRSDLFATGKRFYVFDHEDPEDLRQHMREMYTDPMDGEDRLICGFAVAADGKPGTIVIPGRMTSLGRNWGKLWAITQPIAKTEYLHPDSSTIWAHFVETRSSLSDSTQEGTSPGTQNTSLREAPIGGSSRPRPDYMG